MKQTVEELIAKYIELRNKKSQVKAECDKKIAVLDEGLGLIETALKLKADEQGVDSFKTKAGTMYLTTVDRASVADWNAVLAFVVKNERFDMLNKAVNKTAVKEYVDTHEVPPPGVNFVRSVGVNIRKPSTSVDSLGE